jgi:hypothetical protein
MSCLIVMQIDDLYRAVVNRATNWIADCFAHAALHQTVQRKHRLKTVAVAASIPIVAGGDFGYIPGRSRL